MSTDVLQWLTDDASDVSVRFQALRDLAGTDSGKLELLRVLRTYNREHP